MGSKYKIKKTDLKAFFATVEMAMKDHYHELYIRLGLVKGKNGNFKCINEHAHSHGADKNPSMSISNSTGQWHCFTCEIKGNLQSYWSEYLKGGSGGDSYTDFLIDSGNMAESSLMKFSDRREDPKFEENSRQLRKLYDSLQNEKIRSLGRPWLISGELTTIIKELSTIPMKNLDEWVDNLLNNEEAMRYLWETRRITPEVVKKYRLGWFQHISRDAKGNEYRKWKYIFPTINAEGDLTNVKCYDPKASDSSRKWMHPYKGFESGPVPINNFTEKKIMFLEGEPDLYCAISFGFEGCVTLGSKSMNDVDKVFGSARAKQLFSNKEIIICLDADEKETGGSSSSKKLALSLYPYARQIKIINLNKSNINPNGLDPNLFKEVTNSSTGTTKQKRAEKDFTDFMVKNGFDERAKKIFEKLVDDTPVFTHNPSRIAKQTFKVTLQEARMSRYFSADRSKELELSASLVDYCPHAYMYPIRFSVTCNAISGIGFDGKCKNCVISKKELEEESSKGSVEFFIVGEKDDDKINNPKYNEVSDHNILGLIEITDNQKLQQQKKLVGINEMCKQVVITDLENSKLIHVRLGRDVSQLGETQESASPIEVEMDAYINSDNEILASKTYKLSGSQTTAWTGQQAVLFVRKATPVETSVESFEMNQEIHDLLCIFKPQDGESIKDSLGKRYDILADLAGITGRRDLFFLNDLAFFSAIEIKNKMLPEVTRGWVEVLIAGDSRTGKTVINKFLHNYYNVGEVVGGSSGVSRSGLIGGVTYFKQRPQIKWGKIPFYDKSVITIDEMGRITEKDLSDINDTRSSGIAKLELIKSGQAPARTRKIFLSNPRKIRSEEEKDYTYGIQLLKDLCMSEPFLARFDVATVVYSKDVSVSLFKSKYESETIKFTKFQCRHLIMWAYSRTADDIIFEEEEEFNIAVNIAQQELSSIFHSDTQLINQESRAKLVRLSVSLATMLYSTPKNNPNKILVKKEHLDYIKKFLIELYCSENMGMGEFSKMKYDCENLGDMTFMNCICKYVDIKPLARESEFSDKGIQQIFFDYIQRVNRKELFIPDAKSDSRLTTGLFINDANSKLIGILTTRNCLVRASRGMYTKSNMFKKWLEERIRLGEKAPTSNLLEPMERQSNIAIFEKIKELSDARREVKKQGTG